MNRYDSEGLDYETANFNNSDPRNVTTGHNSVTVYGSGSGIPTGLSDFMADAQRNYGMPLSGGPGLGQSYPGGYAEWLARQTSAQMEQQATMVYPVGTPSANTGSNDALRLDCFKEVETRAEAKRGEWRAGLRTRMLNDIGEAIVLGAITGAVAGTAGGAVAGGLPGGVAGAIAGAFIGSVIDVSGTIIGSFWLKEAAATVAWEIGTVRPILEAGRADCDREYPVL